MNPISNPAILVADPDVEMLRQTVNALDSAKYQVIPAGSRETAVSAVRIVALDLLLVDWALASRMPGSSLIDEIHALPGRRDIPVIFTSPGQGPDVIRRQHDFGPAYHLKTPFDSTVLNTLVERALWIPDLVQSRIARPHFNPGVQATTSDQWKTTALLSAAGE